MELLFLEDGKMDMQQCKKKNLTKEIKPDFNKITALKKTIEKKIIASDMLPEDLGEPKITLIYDAIRMTLECISLSKGFKIYNHECYKAFLKEILNESQLGDEFDNYRKIRNAINYYGQEIDKNEATELYLNMKKFITKIQKI